MAADRPSWIRSNWNFSRHIPTWNCTFCSIVMVYLSGPVFQILRIGHFCPHDLVSVRILPNFELIRVQVIWCHLYDLSVKFNVHSSLEKQVIVLKVADRRTAKETDGRTTSLVTTISIPQGWGLKIVLWVQYWWKWTRIVNDNNYSFICNKKNL